MTGNLEYSPTGYVLYDGASLIDGQPIVCIATLHSSNAKTGDMIQVWIMRSDIDPLAASRSGGDYSVCGNCPSRGKPTNRPNGVASERACYVLLHNAPSHVWKHYRAGGYPTAHDIAAVGAGRKVRLGAYGDMAAVPHYVTAGLLCEALGHTGYSHQWDSHVEFDAGHLMASVDSLAEAWAAWAAGYRTFRVVDTFADIVPGFEIPCPNSTHGVQCIDCLLCDGADEDRAAKSKGRIKSIAVVKHGAGAKYWGARAAL